MRGVDCKMLSIEIGGLHQRDVGEITCYAD
jgi:hypothetical protein